MTQKAFNISLQTASRASRWWHDDPNPNIDDECWQKIYDSANHHTILCLSHDSLLTPTFNSTFIHNACHK